MNIVLKELEPKNEMRPTRFSEKLSMMYFVGFVLIFGGFLFYFWRIFSDFS